MSDVLGDSSEPTQNKSVVSLHTSPHAPLNIDESSASRKRPKTLKQKSLPVSKRILTSDEPDSIVPRFSQSVVIDTELGPTHRTTSIRKRRKSSLSQKSKEARRKYSSRSDVPIDQTAAHISRLRVESPVVISDVSESASNESHVDHLNIHASERVSNDSNTPTFPKRTVRRKRGSLSQKSKDARRMVSSRASETEQQRSDRLRHDAEYHSQARDSETEQHRLDRLSQQQQYQSQARASETEQQRLDRLSKKLQYQSHVRTSETEQQHAQRLHKKKQHDSLVRATQTFSEHVHSLEQSRRRRSSTYFSTDDGGHDTGGDNVMSPPPPQVSRQRSTVSPQQGGQVSEGDNAVHALPPQVSRQRSTVSPQQEGQVSEGNIAAHVQVHAPRRSLRRASKQTVTAVIQGGNFRPVPPSPSSSSSPPHPHPLARSTTSAMIEQMEEQSEAEPFNVYPEVMVDNVGDNRPRQGHQQNKSVTLKRYSALNYDPTHTYELDKTVNIGPMNIICQHCNAKRYKGERPGICCSGGKVSLPLIGPVKEPLKSLMSGTTPKSKHFLKNIRAYNSAFQMTSFGQKNLCPGFQSTFRIQGQLYHRIGPLLPNEDREKHEFLQIYFMGDSEAETDRRCELPLGATLDKDIVRDLQAYFHANNVIVKQFKTALEQPEAEGRFRVVIHADRKAPGIHRGRLNAPTTNEVAVLMVGDPTAKRDIIIESRYDSDDESAQAEDNEGEFSSRPRPRRLQRISETHRSYDPLQFPAMHPEGQDGYSIDIPQTTGTKTVSAMQYYAYHFMIRDTQVNHFLQCRDLLNQFAVDTFAKIISERLGFIRREQQRLRVDQYQNARDEMAAATDPNQIGKKFILPSTFVGSPRYMHEKIQDGMTYVRLYGRPTFFITMTCNPNWEEIQNELPPGQKATHRHDIVARVYRRKQQALMHALTRAEIFGAVRAWMYTNEWQKRGLPHSHILLWLKEALRLSQIDDAIRAYLPDQKEDPILYGLVKKHMLHGPCGAHNPRAPCMKNNKCTKSYPRQLVAETQTAHDGYPLYKRPERDDPNDYDLMPHPTRNTEQFKITNAWIVPYNPLLTKIFKCHINVEYCNSIKAIKYVCKYINKGTDQAVIGLEDVNKLDEIKCYETARYICSNESFTREYGFPVHEHWPPVKQLNVHAEGGQQVVFNPARPETLNRPKPTTLTAFFDLCGSDEFAQTLLYNELPQYYTFDEKAKAWKRRKNGTPVPGWPDVKKGDAVGRVYTVHPTSSERFHLRLLLHRVRGPQSFDDLRTVDGQLCESFQQACLMHGLLEDDNHWNDTLTEAALSCTAHQIRTVFAIS